MTVLAIDVGGTRTKAALVRDGAVVAGPLLADTPATGAAAVRAVHDLGRSLANGSTPDAVAVCVPGIVDGGRIVSLPGKLAGIVGTDLAGELGRPFGSRALVVNDAIAYGVGEAVRGAGAGHDRVVVVTIGTGVGVTAVEGGRPLGRGPYGGGLMGGQIPVGPPVPWTDTSGRSDTLEAYCRAQRLVDLAGDGFATVPAVVDAATRGVPAAVSAVAAYRDHLVRALRAVVMAHAPSCVVVGGGPVQEGSPLLDGVEASLRATLWPGQTCAVRPAVLGDVAALIGLFELASGAAGAAGAAGVAAG